jgi:ribosomal protein S5
VKSFTVDPPRREQHLTVGFTSSAAPVDVYVALEKDIDNASMAIQNFKKPEGILAKLEKSSSGSIEAVIPAKAGFGVIVAGPIRDSSVEVKIIGK